MDKTKWGKSTILNCCDIQLGTRIVKKQTIEGCFPVYGGGGATFTTNTYNRENAILISRFALSKECTRFVTGKFFLNDSGLTLAPKDKSLLFNFLKWQIFSLNDKIYDLARGAAQKNLDMKRFPLLTILIPPLAEQRAIAAELDAVQKMIEGYKAQLADLDTLGQSIFLDMFGDVVNNERKWNFVKFGSLTSSINYGTSAPAVDGGKYKYLRMGNITDNGHLDFQDIKYIDIPDNEIAKYIVHKGDILFNRTNSREKVGKTACFMEEEEMIIAGYIIRIRLNEEKSLPLYIAQAFNTPEMKSYLRRLARGSVGQANINSKELSDIKISVPPLPLQQQFAERVEAIERQKELLQAQLAEAQTLMAERMQYYFD